MTSQIVVILDLDKKPSLNTAWPNREIRSDVWITMQLHRIADIFARRPTLVDTTDLVELTDIAGNVIGSFQRLP